MSTNSDITLSIVVPAYNEKDSLSVFIPRLYKIAEDITQFFEIIVVDDGSTDESWSLIKNLRSIFPNLRGIMFVRNFGKESAIRAGLKFSRGMAVVVIDADMQHPPGLISQMFNIWKSERLPVVEAVRGENQNRGLLNGICVSSFYYIMDKCANYQFSGRTDFKLLDRRVVDAFNHLTEKDTCFRGLVSWLGYESRKIPMIVEARGFGDSKWSFYRLSLYALDIATSFTAAPLRLISIASLCFMIFAALLSFQTLAKWFLGKSVEGFTTVIIVILIVGSVISFALGIIGEYISRIYDEIKSRPPFIIKDSV